MTKSMSLRIATIIMVLLIGSIFFAGKPQRSSAQNEGFQSYQLLVFCENSSLASATFWYEMPPGGGTVGRPLMGLKTVCAGKKCGGGPVTLEQALGQFPGNVSLAMRSKVDSHQAKLGKDDPFLTCLGDDKKPESKCEKPAPWFGEPSKDCTDIQAPAVAVNAGAVTVSICGYPVFRHAPKGFTLPFELEAFRRVVAEAVQRSAGSKICCSKLRDAARTGMPCYPAVDIDCDGIPNATDVDTTTATGAAVPDIDIFTSPTGAPVDPFPAGLDPDDKEFFPPADLCDCKWELTKGTLNCSPDGKQPHFYQARWRCPSTGNERFTRKEAPPTAACTPPERKPGKPVGQLIFLPDREPMLPLSDLF